MRRHVLAACAALTLLMALIAPATADPNWTSPPPNDRVVNPLVPDPGISPNAPLTIPSGRLFGTNGAQCWDQHRGINCATERGDLVGMGANAVRIGAIWVALERNKGVWVESEWTRLISTIDSIGLPVIATLSCTPAWASHDSNDRRLSPNASSCNDGVWDDPSILGPGGAAERIGGELVRRLGSRLIGVEVYNEPNFFRYWMPAPQPAVYGRLFSAVSRGVHSVDPNVEVIFSSVLGIARDSTNSADVDNAWYSSSGAGADPGAALGTAGLIKAYTAESFIKAAVSEGGARPRAYDPAGGWDAVSAHPYPPMYGYRVYPPVDGQAGSTAGFTGRFDINRPDSSSPDLVRALKWVDPSPKIYYTETGVTNSGYQMNANPIMKIGPGRDWQRAGYPALVPCGQVVPATDACSPGKQWAVGFDEQAEAIEDMLRYLYSLPETAGVFIHQLYDEGSGYTPGGNPEGVSDTEHEGRIGLIQTPGGSGTTVFKKAYCRVRSLANLSLAVAPYDTACPPGSATTGVYE